MRIKKNVSDRVYIITRCAVFTALAMIFSYIENLIPMMIIVPGVKLGIANVAIITIMYVATVREAVIVNVLRITLTALLFGNFWSFMFSMAGAFLSMTSMVILKKTKLFSITGISVAGAVMHNTGQIIMAVFIMGSQAIIYYLPVLVISAVVTGVIIGIVSGMVAKRVKKACQ